MKHLAALNLGLIGCGHVAQAVHLKILTALPAVNVIALADMSAERRSQANVLAPGAIAYDHYADLLSRPDLNAVVICLPNALHAEVAIAALNAGKHVYLEKPFALTLQQAQAIVNAWQNSGLVGMVGFNYRFNRLYQELRQTIQMQQIGDVVAVRSVFSTAAKPQPDWKRTRQSGGGVLLDLASHHVDLVRFLLNQEVKEVLAQVRSLHSEHDTATLQLRLKNDVLVQSWFSLSAVEDDRIEIFGTAGKLAVDRYRSVAIEHVPTKLGRFARLTQAGQALQTVTRLPYLLEKLRSPWNEPSFRQALSHFVATIRTPQPLIPSFWDGYQNQVILDAASTSIRTQCVTPLSTQDHDSP